MHETVSIGNLMQTIFYLIMFSLKLIINKIFVKNRFWGVKTPMQLPYVQAVKHKTDIFGISEKIFIKNKLKRLWAQIVK